MSSSVLQVGKRWVPGEALASKVADCNTFKVRILAEQSCGFGKLKT